MTNKEIVTKLLRSKGMAVIRGRDDVFTALLPYLMMDECYQLYLKFVKGVKCKFKLKQIKSTWSKGYNLFNHEFLLTFTPDEQEFIFDKMDSFEEYIKETELFLRLAMLRNLRREGIPEDKEDVIASVLMANVLAQSAQVMWNNTYRGKYGMTTNPQIEMVRKATIDFVNEYYHDTKNIDVNSFTDVSDCIDLLCQKMIAWVRKDANVK